MQQGLFLIAMVAILAVNLKTSLVPNAITLPGIPLGIGFSLFAPPGWMSSLLGLSSGAVVFAISELYRRSSGKEGIGMGCVKQMAMIGAFLGWQQAVVAFVLGSWVATGLALIYGARTRPQSALPFGAALSCGAIIASTVGDRILNWYLSL